MNFNIFNFIITIGLVFFMSCADENAIENTNSNNETISIDGFDLRSHLGDHVGSSEDYIVSSLRILIFEKTSGVIKDNTLYKILDQNVISFKIKADTYDFVFIANEPTVTSVKTTLDNISNYTNLNDVAFPAASFSSTLNVPMIQAIQNVKVLSNGLGVEINGGAQVPMITLALNRMAARLDIDLKAEEDLSTTFKGINLSGMPNVVPLFPLAYTGTISHNVSRSYTLAGNPEYFTNLPPPSGHDWAIHVDRVLIPSNDFMPINNSNKAITLTVNIEDKYSPYSKLKIEDTPLNYSLPQNTKLDINGTIKMPLDLNIIAKPWDPVNEDWAINTRKLNVSAIKANITDFNAVRISFSTDLANVRVLPNVVDLLTNAPVETNLVFNDLSSTVSNPNPTRFYFDSSTRTGYMDILVDGGKSDPSQNQPRSSSYKLTLLAESADGKHNIQRDILINVSQYGTRPDYDNYGKGYVGAFYRNNEEGERIISGQHIVGKKWTARVINVDGQPDFIKISSIPSFDPTAGTDNPGNPEQYPVTPNTDRNESGSVVEGSGRIYFRIGMKSKNTNNEPRYGIIEITYYGSDSWETTNYYYIRQGENADYVYSPNESYNYMDGKVLKEQQRTAARKFVPYNLTSPDLKNGSQSASSVLAKRGAVFVDYPTQAGAFFVWATTTTNMLRKAYHPTETIPESDWPQPIGSTAGFWDNDLRSDNDVSPPGYARPSDGYESKKAINGNYLFATGSPDPGGDYSSQIALSHFRVSLFATPQAGNGFKEGVPPTYPGTSPTPPGYESSLEGTKGGIYADGFFDRRPITNNTVSGKNAHIAYGGLLIFNEKTKASLFFPGAGRRANQSRDLQFQGTGYYWSSSIGPWYEHAHHPAWRMALSLYAIGPSSELSNFGHSIRCIQE